MPRLQSSDSSYLPDPLLQQLRGLRLAPKPAGSGDTVRPLKGVDEGEGLLPSREGPHRVHQSVPHIKAPPRLERAMRAYASSCGDHPQWGRTALPLPP